MTWYIHKGDDIQRDQKIHFDFCREYEHYPNSGYLWFIDELIECSDLYDCSNSHYIQYPRTAIQTKLIMYLGRPPDIFLKDAV